MRCDKHVMFATLLAGAAVLLGTGSSAVAGTTTMTSVFRLSSIHMVTTKIGWGTAAGGIGRTSDGASTWKLVLPTKNGAFGRGQDALAVLSSQSALVAEIKANGRRLTVNSTADGGRTWKARPWRFPVPRLTLLRSAASRSRMLFTAGCFCSAKLPWGA